MIFCYQTSKPAFGCDILLLHFTVGLDVKTEAKNIHIYLVNLLIVQHAIHISSLLGNAVSSAVRLCLIISSCAL